MATTEKKSVFATLSTIDVGEHIEKKNGLSYLSWAWAWHYVKASFPAASYTVYENAEGRPYFDDGRTAWVKTGVTIEGLEHIEYLPIMDHYNKSIPLERITSMDMNKAIQRSLTKAVARHGLGLYIYAGEDLPMTDDEVKAEVVAEEARAKKARKKAEAEAPEPEYQPLGSAQYWGVVKAFVDGKRTKSGGDYRAEWISTTHATPEAIARFDADVENVRAARSANILKQ